MFEKKQKGRPVICPICGRSVGLYKGIIGTDSTFSCSECRLFLIYCRDDGTIKIKRDKMSERVASSGRRFL